MSAPPFFGIAAAILIAFSKTSLAAPDPYDPWVRARALKEKKAAALVAKGQSYEDAGRPSKALRSYRAVVAKYRIAPSAAEAQFRIAKLFETGRNHRAAFDAYQAMIDHFKETDRFVEAVESQFRIAKNALDLRRMSKRHRTKVKGDDLPLLKTIAKMFEVLVSNARHLPIAGDAAYYRGVALADASKPNTAIKAHNAFLLDYPDHKHAPDVAFQLGALQLVADRTNFRTDPARLEAARKAFGDMMILYPKSEKVPIAKRKIREIRAEQLANAREEVAFYRKQGNDKAANIVAELIRDEYADLIARE